MSTADVAVLWDSVIRNPGFIVVKSTENSKRLYRTIRSITLNSSKTNDMRALNQAIDVLRRRKTVLNVTLLNKKRFMGGVIGYVNSSKTTFNWMLVDVSATAAAFCGLWEGSTISRNHIVGLRNKTEDRNATRKFKATARWWFITHGSSEKRRKFTASVRTCCGFTTDMTGTIRAAVDSTWLTPIARWRRIWKFWHWRRRWRSDIFWTERSFCRGSTVDQSQPPSAHSTPSYICALLTATSPDSTANPAFCSTRKYRTLLSRVCRKHLRWLTTISVLPTRLHSIEMRRPLPVLSYGVSLVTWQILRCWYLAVYATFMCS